MTTTPANGRNKSRWIPNWSWQRIKQPSGDMQQGWRQPKWLGDGWRQFGRQPHSLHGFRGNSWSFFTMGWLERWYNCQQLHAPDRWDNQKLVGDNCHGGASKHANFVGLYVRCWRDGHGFRRRLRYDHRQHFGSFAPAFLSELRLHSSDRLTAYATKCYHKEQFRQQLLDVRCL